MQVCTSLQTDHHTSTPLLSFLQAGCPSCRPTKALKAKAQQSRNKRITPTGNRMLEGEPTGGQNDWGMSFCFHRGDDSISVSQCSEDASLETRDDIERCGLLQSGVIVGTRNESVPIQLAQCWFPGLAISNAKIQIIIFVKQNIRKQSYQTALGN